MKWLGIGIMGAAGLISAAFVPSETGDLSDKILFATIMLVLIMSLCAFLSDLVKS